MPLQLREMRLFVKGRVSLEEEGVTRVPSPSPSPRTPPTKPGRALSGLDFTGRRRSRGSSVHGKALRLARQPPSLALSLSLSFNVSLPRSRSRPPPLSTFFTATPTRVKRPQMVPAAFTQNRFSLVHPLDTRRRRQPGRTRKMRRGCCSSALVKQWLVAREPPASRYLSLALSLCLSRERAWQRESARERERQREGAVGVPRNRGTPGRASYWGARCGWRWGWGAGERKAKGRLHLLDPPRHKHLHVHLAQHSPREAHDLERAWQTGVQPPGALTSPTWGTLVIRGAWRHAACCL